MIDQSLLFEGMLSAYAGLGKTGKPQRHEHTTLAGIAVSFESKCELEGERVVFVVLATGTKCLPAVARHPCGFAVHDSHAEVLARRAMVRWLMDEVFAIHAGNLSVVFEKGNAGRVRLREGVAFHLVVSSAPCGDCAIVGPGGHDCLVSGNEADGADKVGDTGIIFSRDGMKGRQDDGTDSACVKRQRTGAKLVHASSVLPLQEDVEKASQRVGVVRRKPGRGLPTSSTSCSDKILRWMHLGFQGCLMRSFLEEAVRFSSITAATASQEALQRGVWSRQPVLSLAAPVIRGLFVPKKVLNQYGLCLTEIRVVGAGNSVSWWARGSHQWRLATGSSAKALVAVGSIFSEIPKASKEFREVLIGKSGYVAGCTSKPGATPLPRFHSRLSRSSMRSHFQGLYAASTSNGTTPGGGLELLPSWTVDDQEFKRLVCPAYHAAWAELRDGIGSVFSTWIRK